MGGLSKKVGRGLLALMALCAGLGAGLETSAVPAAAEEKDALAISRKLDRLYRSRTSQGVMEMKVINPNFQRTLKMKIWTQGLENTLVRILSPRKEKGTATLKRGNEMWNYLPKIGKTIRIPPSMMMSSWMGSDLTNDDLVKETSWESDYTVTFEEDPPPGQLGLKYVPKEDAAVTWSRVVAFLDEESLLPVGMDYYDEKNVKVRTMVYSEVKEIGGRRLPVRFEVIPLSQDKKGRRTIILYRELEFDLELSKSLFSLSNLRRGR